MELSSPKIKNFLYLLKKSCSYIWGNGIFYKISYISGREFSEPEK